MYLVQNTLQSQLLQLGMAGSTESELRRLLQTPVLPHKALIPRSQNVCEHARMLLLLRPHHPPPLYRPLLVQHRCLPHFPPLNLGK